MPHITVQMYAGRTPEKKRAFIAALTDATVAALGCSPEAVTIILQDVDKHDWATAGVTAADREAGGKP